MKINLVTVFLVASLISGNAFALSEQKIDYYAGLFAGTIIVNKHCPVKYDLDEVVYRATKDVLTDADYEQLKPVKHQIIVSAMRLIDNGQTSSVCKLYSRILDDFKIPKL